MTSPKYTATMTIPKNGMKIWNDLCQNPPKTLPQGVDEGQYIVASFARFPDGVFVFGGVAVGAESQDFNYPLFMVFNNDCKQVGGWPIDTSDWEGFQASQIQFGIDDDDDEGNYLLKIVEET